MLNIAMLRRDAKRLQKDKGITLSAAQNEIARRHGFPTLHNLVSGMSKATIEGDIWCRIYKINAYTAIAWKYEGQVQFLDSGHQENPLRNIFKLEDISDLRIWVGEACEDETIWDTYKILAEWTQARGLITYVDIPPWLNMASTEYGTDGPDNYCKGILKEIIHDCDIWIKYAAKPSSDCKALMNESQEILLINYLEGFEDLEPMKLINFYYVDSLEDWDIKIVERFKSAVVTYIRRTENFSKWNLNPDDSETIHWKDAHGKTQAMEGRVFHLMAIDHYLYWTKTDKAKHDNWELSSKEYNLKEWVECIARKLGTVIEGAN